VPRWIGPLLALALGLGLHLLVLWGLDLRDLPGPGGVLLARDLLLGEHQQGLASWLLAPATPLGLEPALRLGGALSLLAAMLGAGLAARALASRAAGAWAMALTGCWALTTHQALLVDAGSLAWGLSWLGLGLAWRAGGRDRHGLLALGSGLLALGVAAKASALPVLLLLPLAPFFGHPTASAPPARRLVQLPAALLGLGLGAALGWLAQGSLPWLGAQAAAGPATGTPWWRAVFDLGGAGLPQGSFPLLILLACLGAGLMARRRPLGLLVLALALTSLLLVGGLRAERLQPRHLLPASLGLIALVAALEGQRWRRVGAVALGLLCAAGTLDSLAFATAFSQQRERFALTAPDRLPSVPTPFAQRYAALPWAVLFESSLPGVAELLSIPDGGSSVASVVYQERRDVHLELACLEAGVPYRRLSQQRCCQRDQGLEACAAEVVAGLDAAGALLVLPGKDEVVSPEERPFARAVRAASGRPPRRPARWWSIEGSGQGGALPCREGR
jgi:hypothetical protein